MAVQCRETVLAGAGLYTPNERSKVTIEIEGRLECSQGKRLLPKQTQELVLGEADDTATAGLERLISTMRVGEVAECAVQCSELPGLPFQLVQGADSCQVSLVWYIVKLVSCTRASDSWNMSPSGKLELAEHHKAVGNERFKAGSHSAAASRYSKALKYLITIPPQSTTEEEKDRHKELKMMCLLNLAACQLKLKIFNCAAKNCSKVLETDPGNVKALYRRGQALMYMNDLSSAQRDLEEARNIDRSSKAVNDALRELASREQLQRRHYQQALKSMFGGK